MQGSYIDFIIALILLIKWLADSLFFLIFLRIFSLVVNLIHIKPVLIDAVVQAHDNIFLLKIEAAQACSETLILCVNLPSITRVQKENIWADTEHG